MPSLPPPATGSPVLVGLGNVLLGDDGVGPAICDELRRRVASPEPFDELPVGIELLDGGTLGCAIVPWLAAAGAVVLVDAVRVAGRPGEVLVYRAPDWLIAQHGCSAELANMVAMAVLGGLPREAITLVGIIPDRIRPGLGLSRAVAAAVPLAASVAIGEVRALTRGMA